MLCISIQTYLKVNDVDIFVSTFALKICDSFTIDIKGYSIHTNRWTCTHVLFPKICMFVFIIEIRCTNQQQDRYVKLAEFLYLSSLEVQAVHVLMCPCVPMKVLLEVNNREQQIT